ncbi:MAG: trypsin-like peptidase domain-containing protein [Planctomycetes bacterium]|nr:trypsin-like peptidase domain-containing protein [Planctomycetota bacterium]
MESKRGFRSAGSLGRGASRFIRFVLLALLLLASIPLAAQSRWKPATGQANKGDCDAASTSAAGPDKAADALEAKGLVGRAAVLAHPKAPKGDEKTLCDDCVVGTIACGETVTGTLQAGDCDLGDGTYVDVYRLELAEAQRVAIHLTSPDFDTFLVVEDTVCLPPDAWAVNDDCPGGGLNSCATVDLPAGTYFILANSYSAAATGMYTLQLSCEEAVSLCEDCVAGEIACGETITGTLDAGDCDLGDGSYVDVYRLELADARRVSINLSSAAFDTYLIVTDTVCTSAVASNDDCPGGGLNSCLTVNLPAGTYFILANSYSGGETGTYTVQVGCGEIVSLCDDCVAGTIACGQAVTGALEAGDCDPGDGTYVDVYRFDQTADQQVSISLTSADFDTYLIVEDAACATTDGVVAYNDDCGDSLDSCLTVSLPAGTWFIFANSYGDGETGAYQLELTWCGCRPEPAAPAAPSPVHGASRVPLDAVLAWNGAVPPAGGEAGARPKILYGADDRLDEYQIGDPELLEAGDSTCALVSRSALQDNGDGTYSLPPLTFGADYLNWVGRPLCGDEPFRDQPIPAFCTGFLVAPDVVATAGHCVGAGDCGSVAFVFGFVMEDAATAVLRVDASQVYFCSGLIASEVAAADWGLIALDRPVPDHAPLRVRTSGIIADGQNVTVIGHPLGLPRKYAGGPSTTVRENGNPFYFQANLDTYGGNSGSAVLDAETLQVEGILVRGNVPDFVEDGGCDRSRVCPDDGCPTWEEATRATAFSGMLPSYSVYLGTTPGGLALAASDLVVSSYRPESLQADTQYYWKVVCSTTCGSAEGPVWTFSTGESAGGVVPGDCNHDGGLNISDAVCVFRYLFLGSGNPLPCGDGTRDDPANLSLLDWQPDGQINLSDGIGLLLYLFQAGAPHCLAAASGETPCCLPIAGCPPTCGG